jgi:hypothetical protein
LDQAVDLGLHVRRDHVQMQAILDRLGFGHPGEDPGGFGLVLDRPPSRPVPARVEADAGEAAVCPGVERAADGSGPEAANGEGVGTVERHAGDLDGHSLSLRAEQVDEILACQ